MILFCGDPHGNFDHIVHAVYKHQPAAIVLLGDIEATRPLHIVLDGIRRQTEVWWIPGNHDTDSEANYDNLFNSELANRNLHGRVVEIDGVRIAGLGGVFRTRVWPQHGDISFQSEKDFVARCGKGNRWRGGLPLKHRSTIFPEIVRRLSSQRADILVTHEAPGCHPYGFAALDDLARSMRVQKAFHGHQHDNLDYSSHWADLGYEARGVGFCGITDQDGNIIRRGEFDELRSERATPRP